MKQLSLLLCTLFLGAVASFAQTLDQSNASYDAGQLIVNPNYPHLSQSFTNGLTGTLSRIAVEVQANSVYPTLAGDFELTIYQGEGIGGTVLLTHSFTVVPDFSGELVLNFSPISVTAGTVNTFKISPTAASSGRLLLSMKSGNVYGGGILYNGNFGPSTDYDLWFKTFVNVPTPATHLNFDGSNDFVNLGTSVSTGLNGTTALTLEAWINPSALNGWNNIVTDYDGAYHKFLLRVRNSNNIQFVLNGTFLNTSFSVPLNTWTHVAAVYDGANMYVYVNGTLTASQAATVSLPATSNQVNIGARIGSNTENFTGNIDEVRVWNVARTVEQINGSKNCELAGTESGLLAYYNFNQGVDQANNSTVTVLTDATVNANNGTLTNFALTGTTSNWLAGSPVTTGSIIPSVASVTTPVVYNQGDTASALTATTGTNGTGLLWYTTATGGTGSASAPTPSTATVGSTSYWVSSTNANGCESERVEIVVTVNAPATHLNFDGTNDYVTIPKTFTSDFTIQYWVKTSVIGTSGSQWYNGKSIVDNEVGGVTTDFGTSLLGSKLAFGIGSPDVTIQSTSNINDGTWKHITVTWKQVTGAMQLYVNGVLEATGIGSTSARSASNFIKLATNNSLDNFFNGNIDEVRVWNIVLTATDIMNTMNCEAQTQPQLIAYYKFNQGFDATSNTALTTLTDASGNGNNGTLTNFALTGTTSNWASGSTITTGNTCATLSSSDFENNTTVTIYPNPSNGIFNVEAQETSTIEVYDLIGKLILNQKLAVGTNSFDISNFNTGIYLLKVTNDNGNSQTHKLIKN
ncbi:MAG: hypothetical protein KU29_00220 [Sulfurovum sp. FS06-10]|nr:MAG: hypothetical protein KU29_00220 [Sulfurovum sp. FS06-10]